jgi:FtsP/CotA-like multicopper oxidase with cupredoxin domain
MHLHGMFFQILEMEGAAPLGRGWKDTVNVKSHARVSVAVRFGGPGRWMYHCHILEHVERGMMGELVLSESP